MEKLNGQSGAVDTNPKQEASIVFGEQPCHRVVNIFCDRRYAFNMLKVMPKEAPTQRARKNGEPFEGFIQSMFQYI